MNVIQTIGILNFAVGQLWGACRGRAHRPMLRPAPPGRERASASVSRGLLILANPGSFISLDHNRMVRLSPDLQSVCLHATSELLRKPVLNREGGIKPDWIEDMRLDPQPRTRGFRLAGYIPRR